MICQREDELLDALGRGYVGAELERHVQTCDACSELHNVAGALLDERAIAMSEAPLPSAGTMWFRLQMRHRQEMQAAARRSLLVGQAVTLAVAFILILAVFAPQLADGVKALVPLRPNGPMLLIVATAALTALIAPIGGWIAIKQK
jgi:predicted anti-sigma-YlaC factor YlaD